MFSPLFVDFEMPINLPPITQQPAKAIDQAVAQPQTEQLANLSKLIGITVGNNVLAEVEKVEAISPQQREELLKRTQEVLMQLHRSPVTPAIKAQITQLLEQQQLLNSAETKWVHLLINGRPLLTYTDKPLLAGQSVPVQLSDAQRLVLTDALLSPKSAESLARATATAIQGAALDAVRSATLSTQAALTQSVLTATGKTVLADGPDQAGLFKNNQNNILNNILTNSQSSAQDNTRLQTQALLATALRNLLPQKDQPQQLYSALPAIQQLPLTSRQELLSNSLQQALKTVADQLRSPLQLSNPKLLQMIVKNSGVFFEHKLATNLADNNSAGNNSTGSNIKPGTTPINPGVILTNRLTTQDLKGALLQLLNRINQELSNAAKTPDVPRVNLPGSSTTLNASLAALTQPGTLLPQQHLPGLMQLLHQIPQRSAPELSNKVLRTQLLMLLQQHTLGSLAKVQLQQLHTLNHQQNQADTAQPTQSWLLEIPVKQGHDVQTMEIRLQQEWVEDEKESSENTDKKIRQWSVTLSFKLPDAGGFYAQLTVVNDTVSAKLWAEQEGTLNEAKLKLNNLREQLEAQGVVVKQLQCVQGTPPATTISLQYSLVDVTT
jgi:hypothetical protein